MSRAPETLTGSDSASAAKSSPLRANELKSTFDRPIERADGKVTRREGWAEMLVACRDWCRQYRRLCTSQTMLNDVDGIYRASRGVAVLTPGQALSEANARRYLCESVGLQPWTDSDAGGPVWNRVKGHNVSADAASPQAFPSGDAVRAGAARAVAPRSPVVILLGADAATP